MSTHNLPSNVDRLLNQLVDGQLSSSELEEVEQFLLENPEARQTYFEYLDINLGIQKHKVERLKALDSLFISSKIPDKFVGKKTSFPFSLISYLAVAAASVSFILFVERFFPEKTPPVIVNPRTKEFPETYVATLKRSSDCKWGNEIRPLFSGQRLLSNDLYLKEGIAEFLFDNGVRLVLEGPTAIKIESANSARLLFGSVVLHGDESAPEFELITTEAKFYDIGTQYGIKVAENTSTELHVFEGSVRMQPLEETSRDEDQIQIVNQGVAQFIDKNTIKEIALNPGIFKREVPKSPKDPIAFQKEIIAADSFLPMNETNKNSPSDWQFGGTGWNGPWRNWRTGLKNYTEKGVPENIKLAPAINHPQKSLQPKLLAPSQTGCIEMKAGNIAWRTLNKPIRLDTDAVYYISFFVQKSSPPPNLPSSGQYGHISFRTFDDLNDKKINPRFIQFGVDTNNRPLLSTQLQTLKITPPILYDKPYFIISKIVASQNHPDQIFLRTFSQEEKIPREEPLIWSRTSDPFYDSTVYEHIRIHVGKFSTYFFDELHIGTSWESVTNQF